MALLLGFSFALGAADSVSAQGLKNSLKQHVRKGIEKSDAKAERKKKARAKKKAEEEKAAAQPEPTPAAPPPAAAPSETTPPTAVPPETPPPPAPEPTPPPASEPAAPPAPPKPKPEPDLSLSFNSDDKEAPPKEEEKPSGPKLPVRVLGKNLRLDITFGGGYRGWIPQQYDAVAVEVASYATWNIDLKAKLFSWLSLRRGYYESNGVSAPRTDEASVASTTATFAPKAVWLLGALGVPINKVWEPQLRYESRAFETRAKPEQPVCVVSRDAPEDFDLSTCERSADDLKIISTYETFVAGVRYDPSKSASAVVESKASKFPPMFFGIGLMQYRKPYQLVVDGYTFSEALFDGRFRGVGAAFGIEFGGGIDNYFAEADAQLGLGEVSLTDNLTLNELVPSGKTIGYVQGTGTLGYRWAIIHAAPTLMLVPQIKAGGASFFLVDTDRDESEDGNTATSPSVNWDFLWTAQVSLLIPL